MVLRKMIHFFGKHRLLSSLALVGLGAVVFFTLNYKKKIEGQLTSPISRGTIVLSVYGIGTVTANKSFQMRPGVTTNISRLYVSEGDFVKKGTRLADMDMVTYHAPFDGTITFLPFKRGENIFSQTVALSLVDQTDCYLIVSMEQQGALSVKKGQKVVISFDADREQKYDGVVRSVYSNANSFLARVDVSHLPEKILPGMTADVAIEVDRHENALLIPVAALDQGAVWVKRGKGFPTKTSVKLGFVDKDMAEVVSGDVRVGDRLLIRKNLKP